MFQKLMLKSTICIPPVWKSYDRSQFGRFLTFVSDSILITYPYFRRTSLLFVADSALSLINEPLADILKDAGDYDAY